MKRFWKSYETGRPGLQGWFLVSHQGTAYLPQKHYANNADDEEGSLVIKYSIFPGYVLGTDEVVLLKEAVVVQVIDQ